MRAPKGGDGSAWYPVRHRVAGRSVLCTGIYYEANPLPRVSQEVAE